MVEMKSICYVFKNKSFETFWNFNTKLSFNQIGFHHSFYLSTLEMAVIRVMITATGLILELGDESKNSSCDLNLICFSVLDAQIILYL